MVIEGIDLCKVYMRRFMLLCIFCLIAGVCSGNVQKFGVTGTVVAADTGLPLDYASVVVANNETSLMYFIQTDTLGRFTLSVGKGSYFVEVSYTGYEKQRYMMEVIADTNVMVKLEVASEQLAAAIVESSRIEHDLSGYRMGNISKNVRLTSLPLADILQTAPGVWAVQGENVSIYGRAATIYIDNREVTIPANTLTDYLNTFSGRDVKNIEVITNPGGEYASGNPVIKITTEIEEGGRLLAQAGYTGLSEFRDIFRQSDVLTYKRGKSVVNADFMYNYMRFESASEDRLTDRSGYVESQEESVSESEIPYSIIVNAGLTQNFTKNSFLSVNAYGRFFERNGRETNRDIMELNSALNTNARSHSSDDALRFSALYSNMFENRDRLELRANYFYTDKLNSYADTLVQNGEFTSSSGKSISHSFLIRGNYFTRLLKKNDSFTVGAYYSYLTNEVDNISVWTINGILDDRQQQYRYDYDESLLYGFFDWSYSLKSVAFRVGGRAEYADINGTSYFDFTPNLLATIFINRNRGHVARLGYTMNKQRPSVGDLDPTPYNTGNGYMIVGNPELKSATAHNATLYLTFRNRYTLSAYYGYISDMATPYYYEQDGIMFQSMLNGGTAQNLSLMAQTIINPFKWWNMNVSAGYEYQDMGLSDYTNESHAFALDISTTFMIKGVFNVNGTLKYRSDAISGLNLQENSPVQANVTVNRNFLKNRLRVSLGCADVFNSNKLKKKRVALANGMMREIRNNIGSRSLTISLNYNFNWGDNVISRPRDFGSSDMDGRLGRN